MFIIFAAVIFLVIMVLIGRGFSSVLSVYKSMMDLADRGVKSKGVIIGFESNVKNYGLGSNLYPIVSFENLYGYNVQVESEYFIPKSKYKEYDKVEIYYDPNDHNIVMVDSRSSMIVKMVILGIIFAIFLGLFIFSIFLLVT